MKETIQSIIEFESKKYEGAEFSLVLDIFQNSVENYKVATKRKKLEYVAKTFINACLVASMDALTAAQEYIRYVDLAIKQRKKGV